MKNPLNSRIPLLPFLILLALLFLMAGPPPSFAADQLVDRIVATVNQNVITENQLNLAISDVKRSLEASGRPVPDNAILRSEVLDQLINARLELQAAKENGITADKEDVDKAVQQIATQNNLSVDELYQKLKAQGMDVTRWRNDLQDQILIQKVQQQEVGSSVSLTKEEVEAFAKTLPPLDADAHEFHLNDYLIALPDNASQRAISEAEKQANNLIRQLRQKKPPQMTHVTLHDMGWQPVSGMPSVFAKQIPRMKSGSIAGPIRTGNGFHVLQMTGIRKASDKALVLAPEEDAKEQLFEQKYKSGIAKWLALLRNRATIHMNPED